MSSDRPGSTLKVKYKAASADEFATQHGHDVSRRGIFVKTAKPLKLGARLRFEFQLTTGTPVLSGTGRVVWTRTGSSDASLMPGMGLAFETLDAGGEEVVDRIEKARAKPGSRFDDAAQAEVANDFAREPPAPAAVAAPALPTPPEPAGPSSIPPPPPGPLPPIPRIGAPRVPAMPRIPAVAGARAPGVGAPRMPPTPPRVPPRPAAPPAAGNTDAAAGLFAESDMLDSGPPEPAEPVRSSFFPEPIGTAKSEAVLVNEAVGSSDFLATALSEGGADQRTAAAARAEADEARRLSAPPDRAPFEGLADALFKDAPLEASKRADADVPLELDLGRSSSVRNDATSPRIPSFDSLEPDALDDAPTIEPAPMTASLATFGEADWSAEVPLPERGTEEDDEPTSSRPPSGRPSRGAKAPARTVVLPVVIGVAALAGAAFFVWQGMRVRERAAAPGEQVRVLTVPEAEAAAEAPAEPAAPTDNAPTQAAAQPEPPAEPAATPDAAARTDAGADAGGGAARAAPLVPAP